MEHYDFTPTLIFFKSLESLQGKQQIISKVQQEMESIQSQLIKNSEDAMLSDIYYLENLEYIYMCIRDLELKRTIDDGDDLRKALRKKLTHLICKIKLGEP